MPKTLGFNGIGFKAITLKADTSIKTAVTTSGKSSVIGKGVTIVSNETVGFGTDGALLYGFIEQYEDDGYATVQIRGLKEDVLVVDAGLTLGKPLVLDGAGKVKSSTTTAPILFPAVISSDTTAKTAVVDLG